MVLGTLHRSLPNWRDGLWTGTSSILKDPPGHPCISASHVSQQNHATHFSPIPTELELSVILDSLEETMVADYPSKQEATSEPISRKLEEREPFKCFPTKLSRFPTRFTFKTVKWPQTTSQLHVHDSTPQDNTAPLDQSVRTEEQSSKNPHPSSMTHSLHNPSWPFIPTTPTTDKSDGPSQDSLLAHPTPPHT